MKKLKMQFVFMIAISLFSCKKEKLSIPVKEEVFASSIVSDKYKLHISLPDDYSKNIEYPVLFLLDGDWYMDYFSKELNSLIKSNLVPPCILVGVGYPDQENLWKQRIRDYTFPKNAEYETPSGEGDVFQLFMEDELIPKIESEYSTDQSRYVLMGHSLSGLSVLYNLFQSPNTSFSGFVALSSSLWWENGYSFSLEEKMSESISDVSAKLYIAYGSAESGSLAAYNQEMISRLKARDYPNLEIKSEIHKGASHRQVSWEGLREGVIFTLN